MIDAVRHVEVAPALEHYIVADRRGHPHDVRAAARRLAARQPGAAARGPGLRRVGRTRRSSSPRTSRQMAPVVLAHRVILQPDAELQGRTGAELIARAAADRAGARAAPDADGRTDDQVRAWRPCSPASPSLALGLCAASGLAFDLIGLGLLALVVLAVRRRRAPVAAGDRPRDPAAARAEGIAGDRRAHLRQPRPPHGRRHRRQPAVRRRAGAHRDPAGCARGERGTAHLPPADHASAASSTSARSRSPGATRSSCSARRAATATSNASGSTRACSTCRPLPTGNTRHLEGPSSDTSPQGNITFHRLRDYVVGDDLRLVHWRSSARTGKLVVKHNVDTSQPYTVVLLDQRPGPLHRRVVRVGRRHRRVGARRQLGEQGAGRAAADRRRPSSAARGCATSRR